MLRRRWTVKQAWARGPVTLLLAFRRCGSSDGDAWPLKSVGESWSSFPKYHFIQENGQGDDAPRTTALVALFKEYELLSEYVNEVSRATSFADAAKLGLLLGAAACRNEVRSLAYPVAVVTEKMAATDEKMATTDSAALPPTKAAQPSDRNSTLAQRFAMVANLPKNVVYVEQATERGIFDFAGFTPLQELTIVEWIKHQVAFNSVVNVLRYDADKLTYRHITVEPSCLVRNDDIERAINSKRLPIVCGPSGSGKTATTLFTVSHYPCIYLTPKGDAPAKDAALGALPEPDRNEEVVSRLIDWIRPLLQGYVTKRCDGAVVLVVDELGETPNFLRALCSLYKPAPAEDAQDAEKSAHNARQSQWKRLKDVLLVDTLHLVAVGTGCDRPEGTVGSTNMSCTIIHMDDKCGERVRELLLKQPGVDPSLRLALQCGDDSFELSRVYRAMLNARVAAAFVNEATKSARWKGCDWVRCAPVILSLAFETYFFSNSLQSLSYRQRANQFRRALALCLGGPMQKLEKEDVPICTKFGLLSDCAQRIPRSAFSESEFIDLTPTDAEAKTDETVAVPRKPGAEAKTDEIVAMSRKHPHRYVMSAATREMILSSMFGIASRVRTGDGFEMTMMDFLLVQLLVGSTDMKIEPVANDVLKAVKSATRKLAANADVLLAVQLQETALTPAQALEEVASRAALFVNRTQLTADSGNRITFAAVARNYEKSPAGDAFVVRGALTRKGKADAWVPEEEPVTAKQPLSPSVSLQFKHYTQATLPAYVVKAEFFKMGRVTGADFAGHLASTARPADVKTGNAFRAFVEKQADKFNIVVTLPSQLMADLEEKRKSFTIPPQVAEAAQAERKNTKARSDRKGKGTPDAKNAEPNEEKTKVARSIIFDALKGCTVERVPVAEIVAKVAYGVRKANPTTFDDFIDKLRINRKENRLLMSFLHDRLTRLKARYSVGDIKDFITNCAAAPDIAAGEALFIVALLGHRRAGNVENPSAEVNTTQRADKKKSDFGEANFVRLHDGDMQQSGNEATKLIAEGEVSRSLHPVGVQSAISSRLDSMHYIAFSELTAPCSPAP